jgi:beta-glucanase (GH16 family)
MTAMILRVIACVVLMTVVHSAAVDSHCPVRKAADCQTYPCLIFEDNFDYLNLDTWEHEMTAGGGGNWEFQYYTNNRTNSYAKDGKLFIKPTLTSDKFGEAFLTSGTLDIWGSTPASVCTGNSYYGCLRSGNPSNLINPIQSARLRSVHSFNVRYGKIEVSAKMPTGDWIWPAIWMMPKREGYGGWPASGEIDIVESRGNPDLVNEQGQHKGVNSAGATMHWGPYFPRNGYEQTAGERNSNFGAVFHKYGVEWNANSIRLLIDDEVVVNVNPPAGGFWEMGNFGLPAESNPWRYAQNKIMAPFDQEFYFLLNVAVGGTNGFFPDSWTNRPYPKPWTNPSGTAFRDFWNARNSWYPTWNPTASDGEDAAMQIEYIRVWKVQPDPA